MLPLLILLYAVIVVITFQSLIKLKKYHNLAIIFMVYVPIAIMVGMRDGIGKDYYSYVRDYYSINEHDLFYVEPGFWYLNKTVWLFDVGPTGVFLISSIISFVLIGSRITAESKYQVASLIALFGIGYVTFSLSAVRQSIAIAIFFWGMRYIYNAKFLQYLTTILFGALFHASILFTLPFYFLLRKHIPKKILWIFFFIAVYISFQPTTTHSLLSSVLGLDIFAIYSVYQDRVFDKDGGIRSGLGLITYSLLMLLILHLDNSINNKSASKEKVYAYSLFFGLGGYLIFSGVSDLSRFFNYFTLASVLWFPNFISNIKNKDFRFIMTSFLVLYWLTLYLYPIYTNPQMLVPNFSHFQ